MISPNVFLGECAEFQARMFLKHFMATGKMGEIMCSQVNDRGDRIFFERYCVMDTQFIAVYQVLMEDSLIVQNVQYSYQKIEDFVNVRETENIRRFEDLDEAGKVKQPYEEFTRYMVESRLAPGKMTINGDRSSQIRILYRQTDIPSDAQQPHLNEYVLLKPLEVLELEQIGDKFNRKESSEEEYVMELAAWKMLYLMNGMQAMYPDLATTLPFLKATSRVTPRIYEWPREIDVEREAGLK